MIEDRQVSPFIIFKFLPTQKYYVDFPFTKEDNDYQKRRFYSDEIPLELDKFTKITKGKFIDKYNLK